MTYDEMLTHLAAAGKARRPSWPAGFYIQTAVLPRSGPLLTGIEVKIDQWDAALGRLLPWQPFPGDMAEPDWRAVNG